MFGMARKNYPRPVAVIRYDALLLPPSITTNGGGVFQQTIVSDTRIQRPQANQEMMPTTKTTDPVRAKAAALELLRDEELGMTNPTTTRDQAVPVRTRKTRPQPM